MQGKHLFEYAVIRVVPRVEREEFINVGIILFCKAARFLQCKYLLETGRLAALCPVADEDVIKAHLLSFEKICEGNGAGASIAALDLPSRFRWLTATRSTVVQTSKVHPGFGNDLSATLSKLFTDLVE